MKKWLKGIVFAFVFLAGILPCKTVFADDGWGTYGDNIKWHFYEATGTLQIEGEGAMPNGYDVPWKSFRDAIRTVEIGKGVTHIGDGAFASSGNLSQVKFSNTVESIGHHAFEKTGLKKISLPKNIGFIGEGCFSYCGNLESVSISGTVKSIGKHAFQYCKKLSTVKLGNGVEKLEAMCFAYTAITTIDLPSTLTEIGLEAFFCCEQLDHINIPASVISIGETAFCRNSSLRYVNYEAQCGIPDNCFSKCYNLSAVKLNNGVPSIGSHAFLLNKKIAVYIPASISLIDNFAFSDSEATFYGYTDSEAYNYAGMKQYISFVDVEAQGMDKWEKAWNQAIKEGAPDDGTKKTMKFTSLNIKKGATKITGKLSVSGATVKIKIGNADYKKATVTKNSFSMKSPKLKKGTVVRIRVTKDGYQTLSKLVKVK